MRAFVAVCILSVASANFFTDLGNTLLHTGEQVAHTALSVVTPENVEKLVQTLGPAAVSTLVAAAGKRQAQEPDAFLQNAAHSIGNIFHSYADQLQGFNKKIHSLEALQGDVHKLVADIEHARLTHEAAADNVMQQVHTYINALHANSKRQAGGAQGLLSGLAGTFQGTVDALKQTFGGVAGGLQSTLGGLLSSVQQHLSGLAGNAAGLLAQGQEALQGVHTQAAQLVHQAHAGVQGQAAQALDALLHPASSN